MKKKIMIGDLYEIRLKDELISYAAVIAHDEMMGFLIRVFKYCGKRSIPVEVALKLDQVFPPVFCGLRAGIRDGTWRKIAEGCVPPEAIPNFIVSTRSHLDIDDDSWRVVQGKEFSRMRKLTDEEKKLEIWSIWGVDILGDRIVSYGVLAGDGWGNVLARAIGAGGVAEGTEAVDVCGAGDGIEGV